MNTKVSSVVASLLLWPAVLASCAEEPTARNASVAELLEALAPEPVKVVLDAESGGEISGTGTRFMIPPGSIFLSGGQPADLDTDGDGKADSRRARGQVVVELRELLTPEAMMNAGRPTVTTDGQLLESGGAFDLTIAGDEGELLVTNLTDLVITPEAQPSNPDGMELWVADTGAPRFGWERPAAEPLLAQREGQSFLLPNVPSSRINIPRPAKNIDVPRSNTPRLTTQAPVRVQVLGDELSDAAVFFFPRGLFSVVRLEREARTDGMIFVAPGSTLGESLTGSLVVVSRAGGLTLFERRELALSAAPGGERSIAVRPRPITAAELARQLLPR
ncbi:MAG: hypothetical protein IPI49_00980 [Myxococcales bacterium]|nr:hypothetical protein [Myxococcales bacterium]